ncbi:hypothetical protein [Sporolactobacillus putidus]|uniref:Aldose 1-epimerase n=1 Tax=Sporolactobacillus putidus TaxID=492735 RepID=A0A917W0Q9_9BACL|nr:hypothetical protein [Sporolactobacillus putidus]GGL54518.1 hypothetical protein GCM10007968_18240 [Sporolactobacillus putidus]
MIEQDKQYRNTVLCVEGDQPFACIEPWTARTNAFNEDSLLLVKSGEPLKLNLSFYLEDR